MSTIDALKWVKAKKLMLYTSIGLQTWEIQVYLAKTMKIFQTIVVPARKESEYIQIKQSAITQFELNEEIVSFLPSISSKNQRSKKAHLNLRDKTVINASDMLLPVSIRKGGNLEKIIEQRATLLDAANINREFQIPYDPHHKSFAYNLSNKKAVPAVSSIRNHFLIHWTRAANGPWPTETCGDYYRAVIESDRYPRLAFDTLKNILVLKQIKASSRHMPQNVSAVSFSAVSPSEMLPLFKWRSRYVQMAFEPYGIGIEKKYAIEHGIRPVHYYKGKQPRSDVESWLTQSEGVKGDWRLEREYRFFGDLDLSTIPLDKMVCFCFRPEEADEITDRFGIKTFFMQEP
jgi:hypothetical protein